MSKSPYLIHLADHIANLETLVADIEWNDPDDDRLDSLRLALEQARKDLADGKVWHPLF